MKKKIKEYIETIDKMIKSIKKKKKKKNGRVYTTEELKKELGLC